ncbi:hypothetical protein K8I61_04325 [bacterium]|nr:hypothetical protein [bacterium]
MKREKFVFEPELELRVVEREPVSPDEPNEEEILALLAILALGDLLGEDEKDAKKRDPFGLN